MDKCYVPNAFIVSYDLETVINTEQSSHSGTFVQRESRGALSFVSFHVLTVLACPHRLR